MQVFKRPGRIAMLAAAAAGLMTVAPATTASARQSDDKVEVTFCNKTSGKLFLALSYVETPGSRDWIVEGWKNLAGNSCESWEFGRGRVFYYYAEDVGPEGSWGGDFMLCVSYPGPFRRINNSAYSCDDDDLKGFKKIDPGEDDTFRLNLNP